MGRRVRWIEQWATLQHTGPLLVQTADPSIAIVQSIRYALSNLPSILKPSASGESSFSTTFPGTPFPTAISSSFFHVLGQCKRIFSIETNENCKSYNTMVTSSSSRIRSPILHTIPTVLLILEGRSTKYRVQ